jgi:hypothetical protein
MLVQANSGGGKSRAIRQLLEETHGRVQHLVLDPEGEFATLRERFDYVLAGKRGGDVAGDAEDGEAALPPADGARRVGGDRPLRSQAPERREFVKLFLDRADGAPARPLAADPRRDRRGARLRARSAAAASRSRPSRDHALHAGPEARLLRGARDAADLEAAQGRRGELLNKLIGRTGLDVDVKRAGDELGLDKERRAQLAQLAPGRVLRVRAGDREPR